MIDATPNRSDVKDWSAPCRKLGIRKLSPHVGAEVGNIDLTQPLQPDEIEELHRAFAQNGVLFFRDQKIDFEAQKRLARYFGELHIHVGPSTGSEALEEDPVVRRQHFDETSKKISGEAWHTDQSCADVPPMASILYNHTIPPDGGGDTLFASMYAAYDELTPRMKEFLEGLTATHDGSRAFGPGSPVNVHPVIPRHPVTGRKLVYVNPGQTSHINELSKSESKAVLEFLYEHCADLRWQIRFSWQPHSIAFWDNRCTWHRAIWDYFPNVRSGYRVQIKGAAPPKG
jgi:taurine dioxygenase